MPNVNTENKEANIQATMPNKNAVYQRNCKSRCRKCEVDLLKQKIESPGEVNDGPSTQKEISVNHGMGSFYCCICVREDKGFKLHVAKMFRSKKMKPSRRWDMEDLVKKIWIFFLNFWNKLAFAPTKYVTTATVTRVFNMSTSEHSKLPTDLAFNKFDYFWYKRNKKCWCSR